MFVCQEDKKKKSLLFYFGVICLLVVLLGGHKICVLCECGAGCRHCGGAAHAGPGGGGGLYVADRPRLNIYYFLTIF